MSNKRAPLNGRANLLWQAKIRGAAGFSSIGASAVVAIVALLAVVGWQVTRTIQAENTGASPINAFLSGPGQILSEEDRGANGTSTSMGFASATSSRPNDFSNIGNEAFGQLVGTYVALKKSGEYTPVQGEGVANDVASAIRARISYTPYKENDIKTDYDVSYKRVLAYRSDLREALAPLLLNTEPELDILARYIDMHDKNDLKTLGEVAERYKEAADNASRITVPKDASSYHIGTLNALLQFAVTLESFVKNAEDPMATLALLRTYNDAEKDVFTSFDALASYQRRKMP